MDGSLVLQYVLVAAVVLFAGYSLFRIIRKNLSPKKFGSKKTGCEKDCGCS